MPKRKSYKRTPFLTSIFLALLITCGWIIYLNLNSISSSEQIVGLKEFPEGFVSHGIDISHHQARIDWETFEIYADSTIDFIYCKVTEGLTHIDSEFHRNQSALRAMKKRMGAYHFFLPSINAEAQAEHFLNNYVYKPNDLPPVLDVETEANNDDELIENTRIWLEFIEAKIGIRPVIYTSYHFYNTKFKHVFTEYQFWIANYSNYPERMKDANIQHWQYTDKGSIPGISGPVDLNISKREF